MLYAIHMIDRPGASELRDATASAHREFVGQHLEAMFMGGPLVEDDGSTVIGSLIVMEFSSHAAAVEFIAQEPYNQAGVFESVTVRAFKPVVSPA